MGKVYAEISNIYDIYGEEARLERARCTEIYSCKRIGKYNPQKKRPIRLEFMNRLDAADIYGNRYIT